MLYFLNNNQGGELLSESSDFIAQRFKDGVDVHCLLALAAALNGNRADLDRALEKVSEPFKRDAYLLSAFYAAKHNHSSLVFSLLGNVAIQEHWDIAATAFCYGHADLADNIVAAKPKEEENDEFLQDCLVPRGLNNIHRYSR